MPYPSSVGAIETRIRTLANTYAPICSRFECNHKTYEGGTAASPGRTVAYLRIGTGTGAGRPRILIVAGMHAREWAPPDAALTFIENLLAAYTHSKPIVYAKFNDIRSSPHILYKRFLIPYDPDVKQIIERTELYVLPLANPDGRAYTMPPTKVVGWRKNRRPAPPGATCPPLPANTSADELKWLPNDPAGVDLNRNFEIAWDFRNYYSAAFFTAVAAHTVRLGVSDNICATSQTYHGPAASPRIPEPETQNIQDLITANKINFYLDVHSAAGKFLYAWGIAPNQEVDPSKTFKNTALDQNSGGAGRDPSGASPAYAEWMPPGAENAHKKLGGLIRDAILDSTGYTALEAIKSADPIAQNARNSSLYEAVPSISLFGSTPNFEAGVSRDFAFSQQIGVNPGSPITAKALDPVFSYTFECGRFEDGYFQPDVAKEYPKVEREVGMGLATFLAYAANWHAPIPPPPPAPPPPPPAPKSGSHSLCFIATACYGSPLHPQVKFLRDLRDLEINTTEFGRRIMRIVEAVYYSFSASAAEHLRRHPLACTLVRVAIVEPTIYVIRLLAAWLRGMRPPARRVRWLVASLLALTSVSGMAALVTATILLRLLARALVGK